MKTLAWIPNHPDTSGWKVRHQAAVRRLNRNEWSHTNAIVLGIDGWIEYAVAHEKRFESKIGDDYVLGPAWARWGFALREMLNGETGRLDCGTLNTILCDNLTEQGFNPDDGAPQ